MMRRLLPLLLVVPAVVACGHTVAVKAGGTVEIGELEYRLSPQDIRTHAGQIALHVHNFGRLTHNLALSDGQQQLQVSKPIPPGQALWMWVTLAPGRYGLASTLFEDRDLGISGTLTVVR